MSARLPPGDELVRFPRGPQAQILTELSDGSRGPEIRMTLVRDGRRTGIYVALTPGEVRVALDAAEHRLRARRAGAPAGLELVRAAIEGAVPRARERAVIGNELARKAEATGSGHA